MSTKAQETYDKVEALVASGMSKAEAFKRLAAEEKRPVDSLRGAYYSVSRQGQTGSRRTRKRETTVDDAVESAVAGFRRAIASIDAEVAAARERADEAKAEADALAASAAERKQAIEQKITALEA